MKKQKVVNDMYFCVDIGNSNIVVGLFDNNDQKTSDYRLSTKRNMTIDEFGIMFLSILNFKGIKGDDIEGAIISSVVPEIDNTLREAFKKYLNIDPLFVGQGIKSGINIKLDNPKQLGADLLVGAVGATSKYHEPVLIIDIGTAMTMTYVNEKKEFMGGAIMPGIHTAFSNLIDKASKLEDVSYEDVSNVVGHNTKDCIQSGMIFGWCSMIDGMIDRYKEELGEFEVVLTGGEARHLVKHLKHKVIYDDNLLMEGLKTLYIKNKR